ncbi:MAG: FG-GAP-like repeat-containing protein [Acidobacteria bacterium]|nr:FG-GAP-like repeat-containing protein [Acidobacteriota bacterium]
MRPGPPDRPGALASADFNLDGNPDILQANFEAGDLSFFQGEVSGNYVERSPSPFLAQGGPTFIEVADLNADGRPDVVAVDRLARQLSVLLSDPEVTLKPMPSITVGRGPQAVAAADFNGDGRLDLAVTSELDDVILIFNGKGDGNFTFARLLDARSASQKSAETVAGAFGIVAEDFNRDGKVDLAVTQYCTDALAILLGNGNGTFQIPTTLSVGRHPTYLSAARLSDDQLPGLTDDFQDLVVLLTGGEQSDPKDCKKLSGASLAGGVAPLLGNGDGTFTAGAVLPGSTGDAPLQLAVGELRLGASGFDDLVVANFGNSTLALHPASGSGGFLPPTFLGGSSSTLRNPNALALLDRDGDGFIDRIAAANYGGDSLTLFDGGGPSPFVEVPSSPVTATQDPAGLVSGLLGGITDDLALFSTGNASLQTFISMNDGFFFKRRQTPLPFGCGPSAMALGDFDRDGSLDAALAVTDEDGAAGGSTTPALSVLAGSILGTFGTVVGVCAGGSASGSSCTSDASCPGGICSFSLTLGACNGGTNAGKACTGDADCPSATCLLPDPPTPIQAPASALLATDLNQLDADRDGVANSADNCPSRYNPAQDNTRGRTCLLGSNNLQPCTLDTDCPGGTCARLDASGDACDSTDLTAGTCPSPGDCDQDGIADLNDNCADVYNPSQLDADSNGVGTECDHDPDVVSSEPSLAQLEVFMRLMGGTGFEAPQVLTLAGPAGGLVAGSLTIGDATQDLAVTLPGSGNLQILSGDGGGGFSALAPIVLGGEPGALASLDANRQDLDLDGLLNNADNCPTRYNPTQLDTDRDGAGDACSLVDNPDADITITLLAKRGDNCPDVYNFAQTDTDLDGIGDACDSNPSIYNPADDQDADGTPNSTDNCPTRYNPSQQNFNTDAVGDACAQSTDPDGDLHFTALITRDNCPDVYNLDQQDLNLNGIGDACEGLLDLAVADAPGGTLQLVIQSPSGIWMPQPQLPVGSLPTAVSALDLNGDGITDLVVANTGSSTLSVLLGHGDGTYLVNPAFDVPVLPGPNTLQRGFFRRDAVLNLPEVATLSPSLNTPVLAFNILPERADIDVSGKVGGRDLALWAKGFGLARKDPGYAQQIDADINLDGRIDGLDLVFITSQFGTVVPVPP